MPHIVFHAICKIGLGHIARLSVIQRRLTEKRPDLEMEAICHSTKESDFFTCKYTAIGSKGRDLLGALRIRGLTGFLNILQSRLNPKKRKTVIFDVKFSSRIAKRLRSGGHQTVLLQQVFIPNKMVTRLRRALGCFDYILLPYQPEEIEFHYAKHPEVWGLLQSKNIIAIGPIVRPVQRTDDTEKVIFTLGAGGQHAKEAPEYSVQRMLEHYVEAAHILHNAGYKNLYLAKGPLMNIDIDLGPLTVLETMGLPNLFGPKTRVVTRGTYNLGWEAIAAGATLITTERSATSFEYADSRNQFLADQGYAYKAAMNGPALAQAIMQSPPANLAEITAILHAGKAHDHIESIVTQPI